MTVHRRPDGIRRSGSLPQPQGPHDRPFIADRDHGSFRRRRHSAGGMGRACLPRGGGRHAAPRSLHHAPFSLGTGTVRLGRWAVGLAAADPAGADRRHGPRRGAALCQEPQSGRIYLRLQLGQRVRARGRSLLPETPDRGAVHPGHRPPLPDRAGAGGGGSRRADRRGDADRRRQSAVVAPCHLLHRRGGGGPARGWVFCPA